MKKKKSGDLIEAESLFAAKKYSQVISLLSPQVFLYRNEGRYHRLLGYACFYTGDFGGAYSYLQRARDIISDDVDVLLGLALVMVRRRKMTDALQIWLEILDLQPENRQAQKALKMARLLEEDEWLEIIEEQRYAALLPRHPRLSMRFFWRTLVVLVIVAAVAAGAYLVYQSITREAPYRNGEELLNFSMQDYKQGDYSQFAEIILSDSQLQEEMDKLEHFFRQYRDNMVRLEGNRILLSNAPLDVKDRISLLLSQLKAPDFTNFSDNFTYSQIMKDPGLYHGVYVRWKGRVANVSSDADKMQFDLLVGFEDGKVVEGRVPTVIDFAARLQGGEAVEVIGQLSTRDGDAVLMGTSLRLIRSGDQ